ncbi:phosphotransferase [Aliiruegeria sabulilitoris]|uniref:phosphotransferase n=1 Tax=Aliiruegeria sabulilitoris TaxID=1510458 RepID=UPI00082C959E|nr:phosphotransferase [Aliiruegeria sabulilitoris]NDR58647.1 phosphotransferase [Pseudoruegeria sp. M32A2M]
METVYNGANEWTLDTYTRAGRALGLFNGTHLDSRLVVNHSWMVPSRAICWVDESRPILDSLGDLRDDPVLARWLRGSNLERTRALWSDADRLLDVMQELPSCLCHHDAFRRNLMMPPDDDSGSDVVAIDWAFTGPGVLGEELAATIGVSLQFMEVELEDARHLEQSVFDGYVTGLREAGWQGPRSDARLGFTASTSLMLGLGAFGPWLPLLRDPGFEPIVEKIVGVSKDRFIDRLADLHGYFLDLGEEAVSQVRSFP